MDSTSPGLTRPFPSRTRARLGTFIGSAISRLIGLDGGRFRSHEGTLSGQPGQRRRAPDARPLKTGTHRIFRTASHRQSRSFWLPIRPRGMMRGSPFVIAFDRLTMWKRSEKDQQICNDSV